MIDRGPLLHGSDERPCRRQRSCERLRECAHERSNPIDKRADQLVKRLNDAPPGFPKGGGGRDKLLLLGG